MPNYMYVALQEDDKISVFTADPQTGRLTPQVDVPVPHRANTVHYRLAPTLQRSENGEDRALECGMPLGRGDLRRQEKAVTDD